MKGYRLDDPRDFTTYNPLSGEKGITSRIVQWETMIEQSEDSHQKKRLKKELRNIRRSQGTLDTN